MERYEVLREIGAGNFGVAKLVRDVWTNELYAVKLIERGHKIDEHVQREIMNHSSLRHPNIVRFKEVFVAIPIRWTCSCAMLKRLDALSLNTLNDLVDPGGHTFQTITRFDIPTREIPVHCV